MLSPLPIPGAPSMRPLPAVLLLALALPAIGSAQDPAPPAGAKPPAGEKAGGKHKKAPPALSGVPFVKLASTDLSLMGDAYADNEWGFELRLPKDFAVLPDAELARYRQALFTPEKDRMTPEGTVIQIENWKFQNPAGTAWISVKLMQPYMKIESPKDLIDYYRKSDEVSNVASAEAGKLLQFQSRSGRIGFIAQREHAIAPGRPITHKTTMAYLRADEPARSVVIQCSAPKESFDALDQAFNQTLTSFWLKEGRKVDPTVMTSPNKKADLSTSGDLKALVGVNVLLLGIVGFGVFKAMRRRVDPVPVAS